MNDDNRRASSLLRFGRLAVFSRRGSCILILDRCFMKVQSGKTDLRGTKISFCENIEEGWTNAGKNGINTVGHLYLPSMWHTTDVWTRDTRRFPAVQQM